MEIQMKKSIIAVLSGVILGIVLMLGVFSLLNLKPSNEHILAQDKMENNVSVDRNIAGFVAADMTDALIHIEEELADTKELAMHVAETIKQTEETPVAQNNNATTKLPYYIMVNRLANCVTIYTLDENGEYTLPIKAMTCSVGTDNRTPLGISKISDKYVWRLLFGNTYGHYSVRFNGHILFHSVPYTSPANYALKEGQFNLLGEPASQGCIRLCVEDAKWIYDNCAKGTVVEVYDSEDPGPLGKPVMPKVDESSPFKGWDPTDPHPDNPWLHLN